MKTVTLLTPLILSSVQPRRKEYTLYDAQCDGLALPVQPNGAKSWVRWQRTQGKTRRITIGAFGDLSLDAARRAFRSDGTAAAPPETRRDLMTFFELSQAFVTAKRGVYTPRTLSCLCTYLDTQLRPAFGPVPLNKITTPAIAAWFYDYSRTRGGGANQALGHFVTILNWGKAEQLIPFDLPNPTRPLRTNRRAARGRLLSANQLRDLSTVLDQATLSQKVAADAIRLILLTGCRSGEILRLRWDEVKSDRLKLARTKTGPRVVNLSDAASAQLDRLRPHRRSAFVFPAERSDAGHRKSISSAWETMRAKAGLPADIRLHDLRHTYASHAIMSGETLLMTGKLLGHQSPKSTQRYAHLDAAFLAKAADKVSRKVEVLLGG